MKNMVLVRQRMGSRDFPQTGLIIKNGFPATFLRPMQVRLNGSWQDRPADRSKKNDRDDSEACQSNSSDESGSGDRISEDQTLTWRRLHRKDLRSISNRTPPKRLIVVLALAFMYSLL